MLFIPTSAPSVTCTSDLLVSVSWQEGRTPLHLAATREEAAAAVDTLLLESTAAVDVVDEVRREDA